MSSGLASTLTFLIKKKQKNLDYQNSDCASFFLYCCWVFKFTCSLFLFKLNIINTFIFYPVFCWNVEIASAFNDWSGWAISHIFYYLSSCTDAKNLYLIWTLSKEYSWQSFPKISPSQNVIGNQESISQVKCEGQGRNGSINRN